MKKLLLTVCIFAFGLSFAFADDWEEIRNVAKNIKSVSAKFTQSKHMKILARPLISEGRFFFASPSSLRWEYLKPVKSILLMQGNRVKSYIEGRNGLIEDTKSKAQIMEIITQQITAWLNGRFHDDPNFAASLVTGDMTGSPDKIVLTPKSKSFAKIISSIELAVSRKEGTIKSVRINETEDSYTLIEFSEILHNSNIDEKLFREAE
jgi:outer membrane lipoprotein carrier protein